MTISILTDKIWSPTRRPATWAALPFLIAFANIPTAFPPETWIPRLFPIRWNDTRCGSLKHKIKLNIIYYVLQCNEVDGKAKKTGFKTVTKHHFFHANLNKISIWESGSNLYLKMQRLFQKSWFAKNKYFWFTNWENQLTNYKLQHAHSDFVRVWQQKWRRSLRAYILIWEDV